ncbi:tenomodulin [Erpetoichthys calabaricus]|uniref:tenomodulin n=1 Tax=Erpetoichthys calabaricus TaxID=27687 RepID=UPI002234AC6D|nr:tenomodulin [Erpetoichthys calabaricus]
MEGSYKSTSQQSLWKDVETTKQQRIKHREYQLAALMVTLVSLTLVLIIFSIKHFWIPSAAKVYDLHYKVLIDGEERNGIMEIDSRHKMEIFQTGNGTEEVIEIHDYKNGITGIRFSKNQKCYIRTQTKVLPNVTSPENPENVELEEETSKMNLDNSEVWVPAEEPIENRAFLLDSKIFEVCKNMPIHWIHPLYLKDADFHDIEDISLSNEDNTDEDLSQFQKDTEANQEGKRRVRDVMVDVPVNDYRENGVELDHRLDERGICCQYCRQGVRFCQRYFEPLRGYMPYPYYYQGGRVICRIIMPCNWWIARMLGRV